jgi:hypothetical protein
MALPGWIQDRQAQDAIAVARQLACALKMVLKGQEALLRSLKDVEIIGDAESINEAIRSMDTRIAMDAARAYGRLMA